MEYKFLICQDPMISDEEYIFHVKHPRMIIKVDYISDHDDDPIIDEMNSLSAIGAIAYHGNGRYFLQCVDVIDDIKMNPDNSVQMLAKIMRECGDWYVRLLDHEEKENQKLKDSLR